MSRLLGPLLLKNRRFWGWFVPKKFQWLHFLFSGSLIWWTAFWVICLWNEFEETKQCAQRLTVKKFLWKPTKLSSLNIMFDELDVFPSLNSIYLNQVWDRLYFQSFKLKKYFKLENVKNQEQIPFARHYNPRFLYFLPLKSPSKVIKWPLFLFKMMEFSLKRLHSSLNSHF